MVLKFNIYGVGLLSSQNFVVLLNILLFTRFHEGNLVNINEL